MSQILGRLAQFFNEDSPYSITRVAFIWIIVNGTFMAWAALLLEKTDAASASMIFAAVTGVGTGLKLYQKGQERKARADKNKTP